MYIIVVNHWFFMLAPEFLELPFKVFPGIFKVTIESGSKPFTFKFVSFEETASAVMPWSLDTFVMIEFSMLPFLFTAILIRYNCLLQPMQTLD
ncbi:hypothetical protein ACTXT7_007868 [Hymenolepis weldensis]